MTGMVVMLFDCIHYVHGEDALPCWHICKLISASQPAGLSGIGQSVVVQVDDKRAVKPLGNVIGAKSEKALAAKSGKKGKKAQSTASTGDSDGAKFSYSKSGAVFKKLQDERDAAAAGTALKGAADIQPVGKRAASFKL